MVTRTRATKAKKALTEKQVKRIKKATIEVFEEAKKLELKLRALGKAAHPMSVPHKY